MSLLHLGYQRQCVGGKARRPLFSDAPAVHAFFQAYVSIPQQSIPPILFHPQRIQAFSNHIPPVSLVEWPFDHIRAFQHKVRKISQKSLDPFDTFVRMAPSLNLVASNELHYVHCRLSSLVVEVCNFSLGTRKSYFQGGQFPLS